MTVVGKIKWVTGILAVHILILGGCDGSRAGQGNFLDKDYEPIQKVLGDRLVQLRNTVSGGPLTAVRLFSTSTPLLSLMAWNRSIREFSGTHTNGESI